MQPAPSPEPQERRRAATAPDDPRRRGQSNLDERTLAADGGWEISDPKAIYTWFKAKFDDGRRAVARRQIKYLKCWASLRWGIDEGRPSSILLTVLVAEAVARLTDDHIGTDDDTLLATVEEIARRLRKGSFIKNPAKSERKPQSARPKAM